MNQPYYSQQVRISSQEKQLAEEKARRERLTLKAWIEAAIRRHAEVGQDTAGMRDPASQQQSSL